MPVVRTGRSADVRPLLDLQAACYPTLAAITSWTEDHLRSHQRNFPDGQLVLEADDGSVIGTSASFITKSDVAFQPHTFREITHRGTFDGHVATGDALYGAEIMVHPDHRRKGLGRLLYEARYALIRRLGLRYFVAGGRLPGYGEVAAQTSVEQYLADVVAGRRVDRVLTAQLRSGMRVRGVLPNYLNDPNSKNYASLIVWENPDLLARPVETKIGVPLSARIRAARR